MRQSQRPRFRVPPAEPLCCRWHRHLGLQPSRFLKWLRLRRARYRSNESPDHLALGRRCDHLARLVFDGAELPRAHACLRSPERPTSSKPFAYTRCPAKFPRRRNRPPRPARRCAFGLHRHQQPESLRVKAVSRVWLARLRQALSIPESRLRQNHVPVRSEGL